MSAKFVKDSAVLSLPVSGVEDHSDKKGSLVKLSSGAAALNDSATAEAFGVILDGEKAGGRDSVGVLGGNIGTVKLKLGGNVTVIGSRLQQKSDGTVQVDAGTGSRVVMAKALELGSTNELIECVVFTPVVF